MAYEFDSEQQAAIDKFIADAKNFCTAFVNGEGAEAGTFNKRLNEIQGILAYLNEKKQDTIFIQPDEPSTPAMNTLWIDTSVTPAAYKLYNGSWAEIGSTQTGVTTLSELDDVIIGQPSQGQVLKYDGSRWTNSDEIGGSGATTLSEITDLDLSAATNGHVIKMINGEWKTAPDLAGSGGGSGESDPIVATLVLVRQTVLSGRTDATGQANFLELEGALKVGLKASEVPVEIAFSAGFQNGALDFLERLTVDVEAAWTLPTNTTNFLFIERNSETGEVSFGSSLLAPIYEDKQPRAGNIAVGGTPISSGDYSGWPLSSAFDGSESTGWGSSLLGGANLDMSYIGYIWPAGTEHSLAEIHLTQGLAGNMATKIKIQRTLDGINWLDVSIVPVVAGSNVVAVPSGIKGRGWRLIPVALDINPDAIWIVYDLKLIGSAFTVGSHWFDISTMTMYFGSGESWQPKQRVFIGEATTNDFDVISVTTYALQGRYDSGWFNVTPLNQYSKSHNVGVSYCNVQLLARDSSGSGPAHIVDTYWNTGTYMAGGFVDAVDHRNTINIHTGDHAFLELYVDSRADAQYRLTVERRWGIGGGGNITGTGSTSSNSGSIITDPVFWMGM